LDTEVPIVEMTAQFLTQLADQLKHGKNPAQRRAIQSILPLLIARFEAGHYHGQVDAESEFRKLVEQACLRISTKPA
jgi:hypothetical protein